MNLVLCSSLQMQTPKVLYLLGKQYENELYLSKEVYPVLIPAIESLSKEVEQILNDKGNSLCR